MIPVHDLPTGMTSRPMPSPGNKPIRSDLEAIVYQKETVRISKSVKSLKDVGRLPNLKILNEASLLIPNKC